MECQFCKKTFSSKSNLNNHIKTAKYCIKLRTNKVKKTKSNNSKKFECKFCSSTFATKQRLNYHNNICKTKEKLEEQKVFYEKLLTEKDKLIEEQKKKIEKLQNDMKEVAIKASTKPTSIKNTYIQNNLTPLRDEDFTKNIDKLTARMMLEGYERIGQYALEYPLKDKIICVDAARKTIKYKDEEGNLKTDPDMTHICEKFFKSLKKHKNNINDLIEEQLEPLKSDTDVYFKILRNIQDIILSSDGYDTKLKRDFVKYVCNRVSEI